GGHRDQATGSNGVHRPCAAECRKAARRAEQGSRLTNRLTELTWGEFPQPPARHAPTAFVAAADTKRETDETPREHGRLDRQPGGILDRPSAARPDRPAAGEVRRAPAWVRRADRDIASRPKRRRR